MIFLDTDVLLDIALDRRPFSVDSAEIIRLSIADELITGTTPVVISNLYYLIKSKSSERTASKFVLGILDILDFLPHEFQDFNQALSSKFTDKEDAINYFTAKRLGARAIITRNIRDFKHAEITVMTPAQYLLTVR